MTKIIACIDGSSAAEAACDAAAWASQRLNAPLDLLHVLDKSEYIKQNEGQNLSGNIGLGSRENLLQELVELEEKRSRLALEHGKLMLQGARQRVQQQGATEVTTHQRHGDLIGTLEDLQDDTRMLVIGRQGETSEQDSRKLGRHLENVIRAVHRPVLVTLPNFVAPRSFMLAYDGSATADKAIEKVAASELLTGLPCHLVMVAENTEQHQQQLTNAAKTLLTAGFSVTPSLLQGAVEPVLHQYQQDKSIDLMVIGAYGHSRIRQLLLGSNTATMLRMSDVALLVLR